MTNSVGADEHGQFNGDFRGETTTMISSVSGPPVSVFVRANAFVDAESQDMTVSLGGGDPRLVRGPMS
jgi:hypothetical protein